MLDGHKRQQGKLAQYWLSSFQYLLHQFTFSGLLLVRSAAGAPANQAAYLQPLDELDLNVSFISSVVHGKIISQV